MQLYVALIYAAGQGSGRVAVHGAPQATQLLQMRALLLLLPMLLLLLPLLLPWLLQGRRAKHCVALAAVVPSYAR
jgi:hypothetical protein